MKRQKSRVEQEEIEQSEDIQELPTVREKQMMTKEEEFKFLMKFNSPQYHRNPFFGETFGLPWESEQNTLLEEIWNT